MINSNDLEKRLKQIKVKPLTVAEKESQRRYLLSNLPPQKAIAKQFLLLNTRVMAQIILVILIVLGGSIATVKAADNAKPGDLLFPLDRALEEVRVALAPADKKVELELEFAQERVEEVAALAEELSDQPVGSTQPQTTTSTDAMATPTPTISPPADQQRLEEALTLAWEQLLRVEENLGQDQRQAIKPLLDQLAAALQVLPAGSQLKVEIDNGEQEVEIKIKGDNGKREVKFEIEQDGNKIKIESKQDDDYEREDDERDREEDESDDYDDDRDDFVVIGNQDQNSTSSQSYQSKVFLTEVKVEIEQQTSKVKIEWSDDKEVEIKLSTTNLDEIISYISDKYNLSSDEIRSKLKVEYDDDFDSDDESSDDKRDDLDERSKSSQDSGSLTIYSIEAEVKGDQTKIEIKTNQGEEKFYSDMTDYEDLISWLADKYQMSQSDIASKIKFEIDD